LQDGDDDEVDCMRRNVLLARLDNWFSKFKGTKVSTFVDVLFT
jgi:hypothetical protein